MWKEKAFENAGKKIIKSATIDRQSRKEIEPYDSDLLSESYSMIKAEPLKASLRTEQ